MSEQYVTFYQIAKEIAEEEGRSFVQGGEVTDQGAFDSYRATRRRSLIEVLKKTNQLEKFQPKKGEDFQIPLQDKEVIKFFVRYHAEPLNRKVRQAKVANVTGKDAKSIIEKFESSVLKNLPHAVGKEKLGTLAAITQAQSRYALDVAMVGLKEMWEKDIGNLTWRPVSKVTKETKIGKLGIPTEKELRIANDGDAAFLIYYYHHMMLEQSRTWNQLVDIIDELRTEEMCEMADIELEDNNGDERDIEDSYRDIRAVLFEARQVLFDRHIDSLKPKQEITKEKMNVVEELLKQHGKIQS